jgi:integrase
MATLFRRGQIWYINYSRNGKQYRVTTGTTSRKLAQVMLSDLEVRLFMGKLSAEDIDRQVTIETVFSAHVHHITSLVVPDYLNHVKRHLSVWAHYFAAKGIESVEQITHAAIDGFLTSVLEGRAPKTKKEYLTSLKAALNRATRIGQIRFNPARGVKCHGKAVRKVRFLTEDEVALLMSNASDDLRIAIAILTNTGMRLGELWALRWVDVDLVNQQLWVRAYDDFVPKGRKDRSIPMNKQVGRTIAELASRRKDDDLFVYRLTCNKKRLSNKFGRFANKLGIRVRLHDLRHTFASHLAMRGTPVPVIQELLGHAHINTTMIYAHLSPTIHRKEVEKLEF